MCTRPRAGAGAAYHPWVGVYACLRGVEDCGAVWVEGDCTWEGGGAAMAASAACESMGVGCVCEQGLVHVSRDFEQGF